MSTISTKIINSVILQPGEEFVLPPNAILISSTDKNSLSSTCDLSDDLEELTCYLFIIAVGDHDNTDTILWDSQGFRVRGWSYDNVDFNDLSITPTGAAGALPIDINTSLYQSAKTHGLFITDVNFGYQSGDGDNGTHNYIVFKTIPSVAAKLQIKVDTKASYITGNSYVPVSYIKPILLSDATGLTGVPECGSSTSSSSSNTTVLT